ncbi:CBS domain-containing protein [Pseudomonas pohangensis]|uniref:CBS domain-containing protein n=1 Tax=Pseudomonas pohangensis TaxID=364197 RepID=A0A1H2E7D2_9PSED|nr:CBS domain-containing protein [Pseudomonas pohangensis]SDT91086.1 CBS domain-containing protein [Pseudomonas pohangensis]
MSEPKRQVVKTRDVMQKRYILMDGLMTVKEALVRMKEYDATMVLINKRSDQDEYGLVLLSDIAKKVLAKDRSPERVNLYEIMSKPVIGVSPDMDVRYCARLFDQFGLSIAPVIDNGEVIGSVGYTELVLDGLLVEQRSLE